ncbi:unnamed protein product [Adineta ricciae]|uniref:histone deacetylase n=1 Tax=Adineta ricciae TaxID=249248 RepID=A0A814C520_ADIRI|nr:unnamed protein product [Adineta ricciae]CAF1554835.1 unnamed protein product [Adineta ricciae]
MVDLCRLSSLTTNGSLGSVNNSNDSNNGSQNFFPSLFLPYSRLIDPERQDPVTVALAAATAAVMASSAMERTRLEEEKLRVHTKDKKDQSANASAEVKTHLKSFLRRKLQKEGKLEDEDSMEMLRRFQSEPVLANPRRESGNFKIKSDLRQSILHRHRHITPMSDKRHPVRSTPFAQQHQQQQQQHTIPSIPIMSFDSQSSTIPHPEQLWLDLNDLQRKLYSCYSTGSLCGTNVIQPKHLKMTHDNQHRTNILGPKHFIVEEENEALLAKELEEAKIQSAHNSHSSMHSSQPHMFNFTSNDSSIKALNLPSDRLMLHSKSLSSLSALAPSVDEKLKRCLSGSIQMRFTTGIVYDDETLKHECYCKRTDLHLENPRRLLVIYEQLKKSNLLNDCELIQSYCATIDMLTDCHNPTHVYLFGCDPRQRTQQSSALLTERLNSIVQLPCGGFGIHDDADTIWNQAYTARACRLAIGNTIALSKYVVDGKLKNGFALVRPPGHHAAQKPLGFCYFNTVAITAKYLKKHRNIERIAIVDWDIHHGNGTQDLTYDDPDILYISLHRYDNGTYFPGGGRIEECGRDAGLGKNINIAFSGEPQSVMTDVEYLAAFRSIVMPTLQQFQPQLVLVSSGFDACMGHPHPLGGYELTPTCFGYMTNQLMKLADGKVVLVLEGGYELNALAECGKTCVKTLLGHEVPSFSKETLEAKPNAHAVRSLKNVIEIQREFWSSLEQSKHLVPMSHKQAIIS